MPFDSISVQQKTWTLSVSPMQEHSGNANPITEPVNQDRQQHRRYSICSDSRKKLEEITELNEGIVDRVSPKNIRTGRISIPLCLGSTYRDGRTSRRSTWRLLPGQVRWRRRRNGTGDGACRRPGIGGCSCFEIGAMLALVFLPV
jgi:hypothetical protein